MESNHVQNKIYYYVMSISLFNYIYVFIVYRKCSVGPT